MSTRSSSERARGGCCWAVALLVVAAGPACQREAETPDAHAARTAVARYNLALVDAYRSLDQERLAAVATEAERDRVGAIIAGLLARGQVMVARPSEQRVEKVSRLEEDLFEIRTVELWQYEHRSARAREVPADGKKVTYRMTYQVRRTRDGWVVQHAEANDERVGKSQPGRGGGLP